MRIFSRYLLFVLMWLVICVNAVFGQIQWSAPHVVDTGWFSPNPNGCTPIENEPASWSDRLDVPLPPDGADLVRVKIETCDYRFDTSVQNLSPEPLTYGISGLYRYRLGHAPGLFGVPVQPGHPGEYVYGLGGVLAGSDYVMQCGAGGQATFATADPFAQHEGSYTLHFNGGPINPMAMEITPITPEWLVPNRRGAHSLFATVTGQPTMFWYPTGWAGSHNPWSYSVVERVRMTVSVEYGSL